MILAILQARVSSSRLPGKVLKPLLGVPMLLRQIERLDRAWSLDKLIVATSRDAADDALAALCCENGIECCRGSLEDVLDRFYQAARHYAPEHVVRLTGDCPLADPQIIDTVVAFHLDGGFDYATNALAGDFPDGLDVEVMRFACLEAAWREAGLPSQREHVTPFLHSQPQRFKIGQCPPDPVLGEIGQLRWTVDEPADFELVRRIYAALYPQNPAFGTADILEFLNQNPELKTLNSQHERNEGYAKSVRDEALSQGDPRYRRSQEMLARALQTIPLGTQTFSKSTTQYPAGVSPHFVTRGQGSRVWDVDGNEYLDFINSLASLTLGYNDPDVTSAVRAQLDDGVIFSLSHPLEVEVAEKIVEMVPCAEMVRFGKNGSDATAGAVRVARAATGRDHVAVCGYHGWQDWYIGATARSLGVPQRVRELTHNWIYNDPGSLHTLFQQFPDGIAAVILEPMNVAEPIPGFLEEVKAMTHRHGAVLVFDEMITGFRYANGGAQELFGVTPDLATFGKGIANGYPIAAVTGRADLMRLMEEIFFSFTFGGEALSLAAALATMTKLQREPVVATLRAQGQKVLDGLRERILKHRVGDFVTTAGHPSWSFAVIKDAPPYTSWQLKTLFLQEMFARGILTLGTHNMSYAHSDDDVARLLAAYDEVLPLLHDAVANQALDRHLRCQPLEPLFKVR